MTTTDIYVRSTSPTQTPTRPGLRRGGDPTTTRQNPLLFPLRLRSQWTDNAAAIPGVAEFIRATLPSTDAANGVYTIDSIGDCPLLAIGVLGVGDADDAATVRVTLWRAMEMGAPSETNQGNLQENYARSGSVNLTATLGTSVGIDNSLAAVSPDDSNGPVDGSDVRACNLAVINSSTLDTPRLVGRTNEDLQLLVIDMAGAVAVTIEVSVGEGEGAAAAAVPVWTTISG